MKDLHVGRAVTWPASLASQAVGVLGMRGAGKSNLGRVVAEELFASRIPFVVFDPIGNWYGIRAGRDGRPGGGIPVPIFGGQHGDLQLDRNNGQKIADLVIERRLSCVLDLSHADLSETDKRKFLVDFGERLFRRKERESGWLTLIMEEADDYAPQNVHGGEREGSTARTLGMFQRLVKRGRFKGLGALLITQRSAAINKDLLYMVGTLIAFRTTGPRDQDAVGGWVKHNAIGEKVLESLATLDDGEAWVISPEALGSIERQRFRRMETYDTGATPEHGGQAEPATLADIDVPALSKELGEAAERAKAEDPRELRKTIADLRAQLSKAQAAKPAPAPATPKTIEKPVLKDAQVKRLESQTDRVSRAVVLLQSVAHDLDARANEIKAALAAARDTQRGAAGRTLAADGRPRAAVPHLPPASAPVVPRAPRPPDGTAVPTGGLRRMLIALAQRPQGLNRAQLGVRAHLSSKGGSFDTYLSKGRTNGWIVDSQAGGLQATKEGIAAIGTWEPLPTGRALLEHWQRELGGGAARMLEALASVYPESMDRETLGERARVSSAGGSFDTYLSRLRTLELVHGKPLLKASDELFSE